MTTSRKQKRNLDQRPNPAPTKLKNAAVILVDRLIKRLLEACVLWLKDNPGEAERYFSHFFDTTVSTRERDEFLNAFLNHPPKVVLGYSRSTADWPCYAVVISDENEAEPVMGDFVGQDADEEFIGSEFDTVVSVLTYSQHPDQASMLYHLSKAIVHTGKGYLWQEGVIDISLSGGELRPEEELPLDVFMRALRINIKYPYHAPMFLPADPAKIQTLIHACDVMVNGVQGGVHAYGAEDDGED